MGKQYISLEDLDVYKLARKLSALGWEMYKQLKWQEKKITGDQLISSIDSVGANIAEGYGRFHYMDKVKFYYNSRGSLIESKHWVDLLAERSLITAMQKESYMRVYKDIELSLNSLIKSIISVKNNS